MERGNSLQSCSGLDCTASHWTACLSHARDSRRPEEMTIWAKILAQTAWGIKWLHAWSTAEQTLTFSPALSFSRYSSHSLYGLSEMFIFALVPRKCLQRGSVLTLPRHRVWFPHLNPTEHKEYETSLPANGFREKVGERRTAKALNKLSSSLPPQRLQGVHIFYPCPQPQLHAGVGGTEELFPVKASGHSPESRAEISWIRNQECRETGVLHCMSCIEEGDSSFIYEPYAANRSKNKSL